MQQVLDNLKDLPSGTGAKDIDLIFLRGIIESPIVRSLAKVRLTYQLHPIDGVHTFTYTQDHYLVIIVSLWLRRSTVSQRKSLFNKLHVTTGIMTFCFGQCALWTSRLPHIVHPLVCYPLCCHLSNWSKVLENSRSTLSRKVRKDHRICNVQGGRTHLL